MFELSRPECLELLEGNRFGRLAVVIGKGPPMIRPVNYVFDRRSQSVVFRTGEGSKLHALRRATSAAFEIDGVDQGPSTAWSVIIEGALAEVSQPNDVGRLERLEVRPWAPGPKPYWMQLRAWTVTGRLISLDESTLGHRPG